MTETERRGGLARLRQRVHVILDGGGNERLTRIVHGALVCLVVLSVGAVILESDPDFSIDNASLFIAIEYIAVGAFTVEYALRVWCAPEHPPYGHMSAFAARRAFMLSGPAIVDLLAILPFYLSFVVPPNLRVLIFLRLLRFFKLARYSPGMRSLLAVIDAERKALFAWLIILSGAVLFTSAAMHVAEHEAQPEKFGSIPDAMWWSIVTITTVGYGDVTPVTLAGRLIAALTMVTGFVMLGLPVGILATAFAEEIHRREFVVTWSMVASVPLFKSLDASAIAEIMSCLRAHSAPSGTLIVRKGENAHSMYFIASGEVEIDLPQAPVRLGQGQFFGEVALLRKTRRSANVRATEPTKLLVLDAFDLQMLTQRNPDVGRGIEEIAASRVEFAPKGGQGDIIAAELVERDTTPPDAA